MAREENQVVPVQFVMAAKGKFLVVKITDEGKAVILWTFEKVCDVHTNP